MTQTEPTRLIPNLGAEEGARWSALHGHPAVATTTHLWRLLFSQPNSLLGLPTPPPGDWPEALGAQPPGPAFDWLPPGSTSAWLADEGAHAVARDEGRALDAPEADCVMRIHDKAHAVRSAETLGFVPRCLRGLSRVFDPEDLRESERCLREIVDAIEAWPDWAGGAFTLKPRLGSSGRGRVGGKASDLAAVDLVGALPRLAARGGAILEPWLERTTDLSVVLHLARPGSADGPGVTLLGALEQWLTPSGVCLGHLGELDSRGRVFSGSQHEEDMREAAVAIAADAHDRGYFGPLGVDGFAFRVTLPGESSARDVLRPIVEANARFTVGTIATGLVRRALAQVKRSIGIEPGERRAFLLALDLPTGFDSWADFDGVLPGPHLCIALAGSNGTARPALVFAPSIDALRSALRRDRSAAAASA